MTEIIVSIITGVLTLAGVCITAWASVRKSSKDVTSKLETAQAVTDTKIDELTREVRQHNNFAQRVPVLEEQVKVVNHRLEDLEHAAREGGH